MCIRFTAILLILVMSTLSCSSVTSSPPLEITSTVTLGTGKFDDAAWFGDTLAIASTRGIWLYSVSDEIKPIELLPVVGGVDSVSFSPSGKYLASIGAGGGRIWDMENRQQIFTIYERDPRNIYGPTVEDIIFSPDERYLVVSRYDVTSLWDVSLGKAIFTLDGGQPNFSNDSKKLWFVDGRTLILWDLALNQKVWSHWLESSTDLVRISPDEQQIIAASNSDLRLKTTSKGETIGVITDYNFPGRSLRIEFNPANADMFAFVTDDPQADSISIILWDRQANKMLQKLSGYTSVITDIAYSPDGGFLVTSEEWDINTGGSYLRLWDVDTGKQIATSLPFIRDEIKEVHFSPDSNKIVSVHSDGVIRLWDAHNLTLLQNIGHGTVQAVLASDGTSLLTVNQTGLLNLWSINVEQSELTETASLQSDSLPLNDVAGDANLSVIGFTTGDYRDDEVDGRTHTIQLWNPKTGEISLLYEHETEYVGTIAINQQGALLAASKRNGINLWDIETGKRLDQTLTGATDYIHRLTFSPDGRLLASGGCGGRNIELGCNLGEINVWNLSTSEHVLDPLTEHTSAVYGLEFSLDSIQLFSGSGGIIIFDSPDDYSIARWDAATGQQLGEPTAQHEGGISVLMMDNTGQHLISGSGTPLMRGDYSIRIWDAKTLQLQAVLDDNVPPVADVAITADNSRIISVHTDGTVRFWDMPFDK